MITHFRRRGSTIQHYTGRRANRVLQHSLTNWAADPKTTVVQLRGGLAEVIKNEPNADWSIDAVKSGYVELLPAVERPMPLSEQDELDGQWTLRIGDMVLSPAMIERLEAARRFLLREPERSRRLLRLLGASYLAHAEARERPPRKPAVWAKFSYQTSTNSIRTGTISVPLYPVGRQAPEGARESLALYLTS